MKELTMAEAMAAVREASKPSDDGHATVVEICAASGLRNGVVRVRLRDLMTQGKLLVRTVSRYTIDGRRAQVPAYKLRRAK